MGVIPPIVRNEFQIIKFTISIDFVWKYCYRSNHKLVLTHGTYTMGLVMSPILL